MVVEEIFLMVEVMVVKWKVDHVVDGEGGKISRSWWWRRSSDGGGGEEKGSGGDGVAEEE
ncbi:hypothetical protein DY000_02033574 [Brassica cretica]|uniref:Uncharacterized protein n=1 Tax=Brassica cretica TaxID=69181 RepID=A0ABQ7DIF8_BRACR|nr:hypothetical protein DY000_02033574 [Brassica cretica]